MEQHIKDLVTRVAPAVVAVRVRSSTGTGVVISDDGVVLSAAHVSERPDREVHFTFPGGRTARGKTLGMNHELDAGLMKITDEGRWPHAGIGEFHTARLGDWVLGLGHPGGFDPQRSAVVRLGRIITLTADALQTDCTLMAGDSGGPLFDMHGRVLGIHSRISEATTENFHVPIRAYLDAWERLAKGESWGDQRPPPRPWVGARGVDHPDGCLLERISADGPALKAGLKVGDLVTKINGERIQSAADFVEHVNRAKPGEELTFDIKRGDTERSLKVKVETRRRPR
jgi:serine protease Do